MARERRHRTRIPVVARGRRRTAREAARRRLRAADARHGNQAQPTETGDTAAGAGGPAGGAATGRGLGGGVETPVTETPEQALNRRLEDTPEMPATEAIRRMTEADRNLTQIGEQIHRDLQDRIGALPGGALGRDRGVGRPRGVGPVPMVAGVFPPRQQTMGMNFGQFLEYMDDAERRRESSSSAARPGAVSRDRRGLPESWTVSGPVAWTRAGTGRIRRGGDSIPGPETWLPNAMRAVDRGGERMPLMPLWWRVMVGDGDRAIHVVVQDTGTAEAGSEGWMASVVDWMGGSVVGIWLPELVKAGWSLGTGLFHHGEIDDRSDEEAQAQRDMISVLGLRELGEDALQGVSPQCAEVGGESVERLLRRLAQSDTSPGTRATQALRMAVRRLVGEFRNQEALLWDWLERDRRLRGDHMGVGGVAERVVGAWRREWLGRHVRVGLFQFMSRMLPLAPWDGDWVRRMRVVVAVLPSRRAWVAWHELARRGLMVCPTAALIRECWPRSGMEAWGFPPGAVNGEVGGYEGVCGPSPPAGGRGLRRTELQLARMLGGSANLDLPTPGAWLARAEAVPEGYVQRVEQTLEWACQQAQEGPSGLRVSPDVWLWRVRQMLLDLTDGRLWKMSYRGALSLADPSDPPEGGET